MSLCIIRRYFLEFGDLAPDGKYYVTAVTKV